MIFSIRKLQRKELELEVAGLFLFIVLAINRKRNVNRGFSKTSAIVQQ